MAEYIEREAVKSKAVYMHGFGKNKYVPLRVIEEAPAADVAPVRHGRWEYHGGDDDMELYGFCTNCHYGAMTEDDIERLKPKRCPNCGALMDLEGGGGQ